MSNEKPASKGPFSATWLQQIAVRPHVVCHHLLSVHGWKKPAPDEVRHNLPEATEAYFVGRVLGYPAIALVGFTPDGDTVVAIGASTPGWVTERVRRPILREVRWQLSGLPRWLKIWSYFTQIVVDDQGEIGPYEEPFGIALAQLLRQLPKPSQP